MTYLMYKNIQINKCFLKFFKFAFFLSCYVSVVLATSVQMRVVKDTASYGYLGHNVGEMENNQLATTVLPANFSGPQLLQRLLGKCYNFTQDQYRYMFCPFQNFSQYELSSRWNAYHGILGVWSHWDIKNNTFNPMVYNRGDRCGDMERSVQVHLQCGHTEALLNVTEPNKCAYSAIFQSRYVCHNDSLLVYPRLATDLRKRWDQLFTDYYHGEITKKGYNSGVEKVLQAAGLLQNAFTETPVKATTETTTLTGSLFADLLTCNKEYKNLGKEISRLNQEVDALKLLLDLAKMENRTKLHP